MACHAWVGDPAPRTLPRGARRSGGCGKSTWAARSFRPDQVISSDRLRAMVGTGERDQRAGTAAFEVLDLVVDHRLRRRLTTVIDSTALEAAAPRPTSTWRAGAVSRSSPRCSTCPSARCGGATANVPTPCPSAVLTAQLRSLPAALAGIPTEGFDAVVAAHDHDVVVVPPQLVDAPAAARRQQEDPMPLTFGLQLPRFTWPGGSAEIGHHARRDRRRGRGGRVHLDLGDGPLPADPPGRARVGGDARGLHDARLPRRAHDARRASARCAPASPTATSPPSARSSPPSTCCPAGGRWPGSASAGSSASTTSTAGSSRRGAGATSCSRTPSSCSRCCGARDRRGSRGGRSPCPRRSATRGRCRSTFRSSSADPANDARCASSPATPTPATCSATPATVRHKIDVLHRHCADVDRDPAEVTVTNLTSAQVIDAGDERPAEHAGTVDEQIGRYRAYRRGRRADGHRVAPRRRRGRRRALRSRDRRLPLTDDRCHDVPHWHARSLEGGEVGGGLGGRGGELVEGDVDRPLELRVTPGGDVGRGCARPRCRGRRRGSRRPSRSPPARRRSAAG